MATRETSSTVEAAADTANGAAALPGVVNPAALTAGQLARLLGVDEEKVRRHVNEGAPSGLDGTLNLVHYTAWLIRRLKERDGD